MALIDSLDIIYMITAVYSETLAIQKFAVADLVDDEDGKMAE